MPDGGFKKAKYKRGKYKVPRKKTGIIDKVKSAFNQKSPTTPAQQSTNKTVVKNTLTNNPTTKKNPTPAPAVKPKTPPASSSSSASSSSTPPPAAWFNTKNGATAMNPGQNSFLNNLASGNINRQSTTGSYKFDKMPAGNFVPNSTGTSFTSYVDNSGNTIQGNRNSSRGRNTTDRNLSAIPLLKNELMNDNYGGKQSVMSNITNVFADNRGVPTHTKDRQNFKANMEQDIKNYSYARAAYDRNFNYNETVGQIGNRTDKDGNAVTPNNARAGLPTSKTGGTYEWGTTGNTNAAAGNIDLSALDKSMGGTGDPFYIDNRNFVHRAGRKVPVPGKFNVDGSPATTWQYEGDSVYDKSNPDPYPDIPIENYYFRNPIDGAPPTTPFPGGSFHGKSWSELKDEDKRQIRASHDDLQRQEWYGGAIHQGFQEDYEELKYDYDSPKPWSLVDIGKYQGTTNASNQFKIFK